MVANTFLKPQSLDIHPDVQQRKASNPALSVWVGASAGSGKTKVLTDRVLRLLLPDKDGLNNVDPQKILALTFTKAAASEMALRINEELSKWATMPLNGDSKDKKKYLVDSLEYLLGYAPTTKQIHSARQLFAQVIDVPGGLKIMTIHSFCTSILGRFPLEAGLSPNFKAIEENDSNIYLQRAIQKTIKTAQQEKGSELAEAFYNIALVKNEEEVTKLIQKFISERRQIQKIIKDNFSPIGLYTKLCAHFGIDDTSTPEDLIRQACTAESYDEKGLRDAVKALSAGTEKTDQPKADKIQYWLDSDHQSRIKNFTAYENIFFKSAGGIYENLATKGLQKKYPDCEEILQTEALRLQSLKENLAALNISILTRDLFILGQDILNNYSDLKEQIGALDYDDLILNTLNLLTGDTSTLTNLKDVRPWIRYKLDQGIDHILVDEAQDTNPEQWEIIRALTDDFFENQDEDINRTLFVVGDEKQSIYSFQRAAPEKFDDMRRFFNDKITTLNKKFDEVPFITSFRSTPAILEFVDTIFNNKTYKQGLGHLPIEHKSHRKKQPGQVTLWPLFKNPDTEPLDVWAPPTQIIDSISGAQLLANHIADKLESWIDKRDLFSYDRPIRPKDIMILLRTRNAFLDQLVRALKSRNIPVSGVDRMVLNEQLVVQDLCAAAQFALLPDDDLNLATLLKSPFIGIDEETLFNLSYDRKPLSLWDKFRKSKHTEIQTWLNNLISIAGKSRPYEFFAYLLQFPCPADTQSGLCAIQKRLGQEVLDPIDEFLNTVLSFDQDNIPNLQEFLVIQQDNISQIKRELDDAGDVVRIMTIHGAKGLQAPIVILPDTIRSSSGLKKEQILLPEQTKQKLPYFCPKSSNVPPSCEKALTDWEQKQDEEYRRLFYVAATRAESELYIGGYYGKNRPKKESWYEYAEDAFTSLPDVKSTEVEYAAEAELTFSNPATGEPDRIDKDSKDKIHILDAPDWLHKTMPEEPNPPTPLTPSRPSGDLKEISLSPLESGKHDRFKRGNIIHKLLQILPEIPKDKWESKAQKFLSLPAHRLNTAEQKEILKESLAILHDETFAPVFGPNSRAEVPISGMVDKNKRLSGQIDRLVVTEDQVLIVDYKTNRPPPKHTKDVPQIYVNQMNAYAEAIGRIYPEKTIKKALIWTNAGRLMVLD